MCFYQEREREREKLLKKKEHTFFHFQTGSFTNIFKRLDACTNTFITFYVCMHAFMCVSVHMYIHTLCIFYVCMHVCVCCVYVCMHAYITHTYMHVDVSIHHSCIQDFHEPHETIKCISLWRFFGMTINPFSTNPLCHSDLTLMTSFNSPPMMIICRVTFIGGVWFHLWHSGGYTFSLLSYPPLDRIIICFVYAYWIGNGNYCVVLFKNK